MWKEKLLGQEFDNLGQLAQRVAALNSQFQSMRRDTLFQKSTTVAEAYNPYLIDDGYEDEEEEVAAAEWNWGKKTVMVPNPWGRGAMTSMSPNQISSSISSWRKGRSSCPMVMSCYPLIS